MTSKQEEEDTGYRAATGNLRTIRIGYSPVLLPRYNSRRPWLLSVGTRGGCVQHHRFETQEETEAYAVRLAEAGQLLEPMPLPDRKGRSRAADSE